MIMKEESIIFETINNTDFEKMTSKSVDDFEKEYDSLCEELLDKCNPSIYCYQSFDKEKFDIANDIYNELINNENINEEKLMELRNRAILELGIHISTKKLYDKLVKYFDPKIYISSTNYDKDRVSQAGYYYDKVLKAKNDILKLEDIEKEADIFIKVRQQEDLKKKLKEEQLKELQMEKYRNLKKEISEEMVRKDSFFFGALAFLVVIIIIIFTIIDN